MHKKIIYTYHSAINPSYSIRWATPCPPGKGVTMIYFTVPGKPQGKARARTTKFGSYTPQNTVLYENYIKLCYQSKNKECTDKPVSLSINAYFEPPKSVSKAQRQAMLDDLIPPTKKPDIDNIAKVVLDALNGIAYKDDKQVISLSVAKMYSDNPGLVIRINEVKAGD